MEEIDRSNLREIISLHQHTLEADWKEVVEMYKTRPWIQKKKITRSGDTALHVAVTDGQEDTVGKLVDEIVRHEKRFAGETEEEKEKAALEIQNERGDTPLHCAASRGSLSMCKCIAPGNKKLVQVRNKEGETPLFLAALHGHRDAFLFLQSICPDKTLVPCRRNNGETILHCAIRRVYFDLAFQIIHLYEDLVTSVDEKGITPLHILADKPSAFRSITHLRWWSNILYCCIMVEPLKLDTREKGPQHTDRIGMELPENYGVCHDFIKFLNIIFKFVIRRKVIEPKSDAEDPRGDKYRRLPPNYWTCYEFFISGLSYVVGLAGFGFLVDMIKMKEKHVWSVQILDALFKDPSKISIGGGSEPYAFLQDDAYESGGIQKVFKNNPETQKKLQQEVAGETNKEDSKETEKEIEEDSALLVAARNGVVEIVKKILRDKPMAIHETNSKNKNILHVAVENRQPYVFEELKKHSTFWDNLTGAVDIEDNTVLHFAAKLSLFKPWHIPGSAMQMHWEIKWFLYVQDLLPSYVRFHKNKENKTPAEDFVESHEALVQKGGEWLKSTSESCSVVAALISGVAFATSSSIPGGTQDETGKPYLENQPAFNIFAISSLIALCCSITALIMFLAILTSRQQPRDFWRNLPFKLLLGLGALFLSIASMLVSFCSAHFFVLKDNLKQIVFPIYAATCLPATFFAVAQFPLYLDLRTAIFSKVPLPSHKEDAL